MKKLKLPLILLIPVVILAGVLFLVFYETPADIYCAQKLREIPPETWKTYNEKDNNFSIMYPGSWELLPGYTDVSIKIQSNKGGPDVFRLPEDSVIVWITYPNDKIDYSSDYGLYHNLQDIEIDGQKGKRTLPGSFGPEGKSAWGIEAMFKEKQLSLTLVAKDERAIKRNECIFDLMLSTIRFTN